MRNVENGKNIFSKLDTRMIEKSNLDLINFKKYSVFYIK